MAGPSYVGRAIEHDPDTMTLEEWQRVNGRAETPVRGPRSEAGWPTPTANGAAATSPVADSRPPVPAATPQSPRGGDLAGDAGKSARSCAVCGKRMPAGAHALARFCSDECRAAGKRRRDAARKAATSSKPRERPGRRLESARGGSPAVTAGRSTEAGDGRAPDPPRDVGPVAAERESSPTSEPELANASPEPGAEAEAEPELANASPSPTSEPLEAAANAAPEPEPEPLNLPEPDEPAASAAPGPAAGDVAALALELLAAGATVDLEAAGWHLSVRLPR